MSSDRTAGPARRSADLTVPRNARIALSLCIGLVTAAFAWLMQRGMLQDGIAPDSLVLWRGARLVLSGLDPWDATAWARHIPDATLTAWQAPLEPLYYPMPALLVWIPFALGSFLVGSVTFTAIGATLFAYVISREGLHRLWACAGMPFLVAARFGQWSPWLAAAASVPALAFLLPAKPNLGLALLLARRPAVMALVTCAAILVVSFLVMPGWFGVWVRAITSELPRSGAPHPIPLFAFRGAGALLLAALLRWRRPEARLLVLMACVPQLPFWADQLVLATVPRTAREMLWTVLAGHAGFLAWLVFAPKVTLYVPVMQPYALVATYVPALIVVLRRPNDGTAPGWVERMVRGWPAWLRGHVATASAVA